MDSLPPAPPPGWSADDPDRHPRKAVGLPAAMPATAPAASPAGGEADRALRAALLDSRNRWRDAALLAADIVLETDAAGHLVFLAPDQVLGHVADHLIGEPAASLCALPDPRRLPEGRAMRDLRVWARRADGAQACLLLCAAALHDAAGRVVGLRATARDVTAEETAAAASARALRRLEARDGVAARAGRITDPRGRILAWLEGLRDSLGLVAAAVIDLGEGRSPPGTTHLCGTLPDEVLAQAADMPMGAVRHLRAQSQSPHLGPLALLALDGPEERRPVLVALRRTGGRDWDADERHMLSEMALRMRPALGAEWRARALEHEAGTDPLTGLLNRRAFMDGLERRMERSVRNGRAGGALLFLDLDNFKPVNDERGHAAGDAALRHVALLVRDGLRPADLVGRLGGDEFAAWLDGVDEAIACRRAEALLLVATRELRDFGAPGRPLTMSIGIASIAAGTAEDGPAILSRADGAMYAAKRRGRACWDVARPALIDDPALPGGEAAWHGRRAPERPS